MVAVTATAIATNLIENNDDDVYNSNSTSNATNATNMNVLEYKHSTR